MKTEEELREYYRNYNKARSASQAEYQKIYRLQNADRISQQKKDWAEKNEDRLRENRRLYYLENKSKILANTKAYRKANRLRSNAQKRAYRKLNGFRFIKGKRAWRERNKEKERARNRFLYYNSPTFKARLERTKDQRREYKRLYRKKNILKIRASNEKRRALKRGVTVGDLKVIEQWESRWKSLPEVRCYWCMGFFPPIECHSDHVIAVSRGGGHNISNLCIACKQCNLRKYCRPFHEWNSMLSQPVIL